MLSLAGIDKMKIEAIIFDWIGTLYQRDRGLFPEAKRVVKELSSRYNLGLISLANEEEKRLEELDSSGIEEYFSSIIVATEKTPKQYLKCIEEMETTPKRTAIVGDRMIREIQIGNKLGCATFWIPRGEHAHETPNEETGEPTYTIDSISELVRHL